MQCHQNDGKHIEFPSLVERIINLMAVSCNGLMFTNVQRFIIVMDIYLNIQAIEGTCQKNFYSQIQFYVFKWFHGADVVFFVFKLKYLTRFVYDETKGI